MISNQRLQFIYTCRFRIFSHNMPWFNVTLIVEKVSPLNLNCLNFDMPEFLELLHAAYFIISRYFILISLISFSVHRKSRYTINFQSCTQIQEGRKGIIVTFLNNTNPCWSSITRQTKSRSRLFAFQAYFWYNFLFLCCYPMSLI